MRTLADKLGVPVMTIYNHVPNTDALYEFVLPRAPIRHRLWRGVVGPSVRR